MFEAMLLVVLHFRQMSVKHHICLHSCRIDLTCKVHCSREPGGSVRAVSLTTPAVRCRNDGNGRLDFERTPFRHLASPPAFESFRGMCTKLNAAGCATILLHH